MAGWIKETTRPPDHQTSTRDSEVWTVLGSCIWVLDSSYVLQAQFLPGSHQLLLVFANTTDLQPPGYVACARVSGRV